MMMILITMRCPSLFYPTVIIINNNIINLSLLFLFILTQQKRAGAGLEPLIDRTSTPFWRWLCPDPMEGRWGGHYDMLHDQPRNAAYAQAIRRYMRTRPGKPADDDSDSHENDHDHNHDYDNDSRSAACKYHAVDIGTGTGFLSLHVHSAAAECRADVDITAFECIPDLVSQR